MYIKCLHITYIHISADILKVRIEKLIKAIRIRGPP